MVHVGESCHSTFRGSLCGLHPGIDPGRARLLQVVLDGITKPRSRCGVMGNHPSRRGKILVLGEIFAILIHFDPFWGCGYSVYIRIPDLFQNPIPISTHPFTSTPHTRPHHCLPPHPFRPPKTDQWQPGGQRGSMMHQKRPRPYTQTERTYGYLWESYG